MVAADGEEGLADLAGARVCCVHSVGDGDFDGEVREEVVGAGVVVDSSDGDDNVIQVVSVCWYWLLLARLFRKGEERGTVIERRVGDLGFQSRRRWRDAIINVEEEGELWSWDLASPWGGSHLERSCVDDS